MLKPKKSYKYKGYKYSSRTDTRHAEKDGHLKVGNCYILVRTDLERDEAVIAVPGLGHWSVGLGCLEPYGIKAKNLPSWW